GAASDPRQQVADRGADRIRARHAPAGGRRGAAHVRLLQTGALVSRFLPFCCGLVVLVSVSVAGQSSSSTAMPARAGHDIDFIGPPLADPVMQHAKETYVIFGCAYCHGVTLTPRGEATDLTRSALVGSDTNGDRIAALLRSGIPQTAK